MDTILMENVVTDRHTDEGQTLVDHDISRPGAKLKVS